MSKAVDRTAANDTKLGTNEPAAPAPALAAATDIRHASRRRRPIARPSSAPTSNKPPVLTAPMSEVGCGGHRGLSVFCAAREAFGIQTRIVVKAPDVNGGSEPH